MLSLLGSLLGFTSSVVPDIIVLLRERSVRKHDMAVLQMQIEAQKADVLNKLGTC